MFDVEAYMGAHRSRIEKELDRYLPPAATRPAVLHEAMRYSVFAGGKRLRPILCVATCEAVGGSAEPAWLPAAALELMHTYTLIHDDLPAMDNDVLRRGKPTCHVVFGEANAILAGDALLTLAFEWMARSLPPPPYQPGHYVLELAEAAGSLGVIGGQVEDLAAEGQPPTAELVEHIHQRKTAALIRASIRIGAAAGRATEEEFNALTLYGGDIGLAYQITDDILDATATTESLGKTAGKDQARRKCTWVEVFGLEASWQKAHALADRAIEALKPLHRKGEALKSLAHFLVNRES
ncbi:MAG TPA: polyprenyl synthetase family protein [Kiritimatiellia bacterium]|nr:polyprenyl synthetase family protein [Kiritimatiellia bacterium]HRZ11230.1 polyprenyl synthetase family protein [Kiritimatiellia bacterium]HSA19081.1 polyprenyl synthetase family protein [Kiritimatiellia bacterium]